MWGWGRQAGVPRTAGGGEGQQDAPQSLSPSRRRLCTVPPPRASSRLSSPASMPLSSPTAPPVRDVGLGSGPAPWPWRGPGPERVLSSASGCGKTYTMLGTDGEPGICARTLGELFQAIEDTSGDVEYEVSMSYLEVRQGRGGPVPLPRKGGGQRMAHGPKPNIFVPSVGRCVPVGPHAGRGMCPAPSPCPDLQRDDPGPAEPLAGLPAAAGGRRWHRPGGWHHRGLRHQRRRGEPAGAPRAWWGGRIQQASPCPALPVRPRSCSCWREGTGSGRRSPRPPTAPRHAPTRCCRSPCAGGTGAGGCATAASL